MLADHGEWVVEVDRPSRPARRGGKTDALDAVRAAREALAQERPAAPRQRGDRQALRVLLATRHGAVVSRTCAINQLKALIVGAPEELRAELRGRSTNSQVAYCAALRDRPGRSLEHRMTVRVLRSTARRIQALAAEAAELEGELGRLVAAVAPWLLELPGVGPLSAAQVLVSWSHVGRVRSEAAFAALAGVSPIPASSGQVIRHRLNRGGDRQLNRALHNRRGAPARRSRNPRLCRQAPCGRQVPAGDSPLRKASGRPPTVQTAGALGPARCGGGAGLVAELALTLVDPLRQSTVGGGPGTAFSSARSPRQQVPLA
jgi:transposase